jgi:hypothetical protein
MHDLATDSKSFWISGAQWTNSCFQKLYVGFLISSMNVIRSPGRERGNPPVKTNMYTIIKFTIIKNTYCPGGIVTACGAYGS